MGLSNFPSPTEGVLPVLVMNTVWSVALLKNMVRSVLHVVGGAAAASGDDANSSNLDGDYYYSSPLDNEDFECASHPRRTRRKILISRYESLCRSRCKNNNSNIGRGNSSDDTRIDNKWTLMECCVCLCRFEADEEVSELSCKHFFHKACLDKWFDNQHSSCPLCRSIL